MDYTVKINRVGSKMVIRLKPGSRVFSISGNTAYDGEEEVSRRRVQKELRRMLGTTDGDKAYTKAVLLLELS